MVSLGLNQHARAVEDDVLAGASNLGDNTAGTTYTTTATTTSDITFLAATTYANAGAFTLTPALSIGSLDDLNATAITINGTALLTLNNTGVDNVVAPANGGSAADSLFVASGGSLTINDTAGLSVLNTSAFDAIGTLNLGTTGVTIAAGTTLSFTGAGATTVGGVIATSTGAVAVNDAGGSVTFSGANLYTGGLTLTAGTIQANTSTGALGAGALALNGGTLDFNNGAGLNFGRNTTIGGSTTIVSEKNAAGAGVTYTLGTLSIGASTLNVTGGNVTSGTAGLTFGATTLTGASTFNLTNPTGGGTTLLSLGAVTNGGNTATFTGNGNFAQTGVISGTGGLTFGVSGGTAYSGTATVSQLNSFTGNVVINGGAVNATVANNIANPTTGALGNSSTAGRTVTINNGGTLSLNAGNVFGGGTSNPATTLIINQGGLVQNSPGNFEPVGPIQLNGGTLRSLGGNQAAFPAYQLRGNITTGGTSTSTISTNGAAFSQFGLQAGASTTTTFNVGSTGQAAGTPDLLVSAVLANGFNPGAQTLVASGFIKSGAGLMTLTGANTYTGATTVTGGTLAASGTMTNRALGGTTSIAVNNGATLLLGTANQLNATTPAPITLGTTAVQTPASTTGMLSAVAGANQGAAATVTGGTVAVNGNGNFTTTGGTVTGTNTAGLGTLILSNTATLTFGGTGTTLVFGTFTPNGNLLTITGYTNNGVLTAGNSGTAADDRLIFSGDQSGNFARFDFGSGPGVGVGEIALNGGFYEVAFTAVPEPSTWVGVLLLGAMAWQYRRQGRRTVG